MICLVMRSAQSELSVLHLAISRYCIIARVRYELFFVAADLSDANFGNWNARRTGLNLERWSFANACFCMSANFQWRRICSPGP
jgi:hypothetical protein